MAKSARELRQMADTCLANARTAGPERARQLRQGARAFRAQALRQLLTEHSLQVGRANVTQASFRQFVRESRS